MSKMTMLYSVPYGDNYIGLWAGEDYRPACALYKARGRIQIRFQGVRSGGLHQIGLFGPRKTLLAERAIALVDELRNWPVMPFAEFQKQATSQARNWYGLR